MDVVFFDAAGTLFKVKGSVGQIYSRVAERHGVAADPEELEKWFAAAFRAQSRDGLPTSGNRGQLAEKAWWMDVVRLVFAQKMTSQVMREYFEDVFEAFRSARSWDLYEDTLPCLERLRSAGYRLAVISNFDSRLFDLLANLEIDHYFERVVLSWHTGAAKPDPLIFRRALDSMTVAPQQALHTGDSIHEDAAGAAAAGMTAVLLDRGARHLGYKSGIRIESLLGLLQYLPDRRI